MTNFLGKAEIDHGVECARHLGAIMEALKLPDAAPGEYLEGAGVLLLFLNRYGLVLRAGLDFSIPAHDHIIAPLRAARNLPFADGSTRRAAELVPGVTAVISDDSELHFLRDTLDQQKLCFSDLKPANAGYIPAATAQFPHGIPVVLDRGAVYYYGTEAKAAFNTFAQPSLQKEIYAPVTAALGGAWPETEPLPFCDLADFREACRAEVSRQNDGLLKAAWTRPDLSRYSKPAEAAACAARYERRLERYTNIARLFRGWRAS